MKLVFVVFDYPDEKRSVFPFVKSLVTAMADRGNTCAVVAPFSLSRCKRFHKIITVEKTESNQDVVVIRPPYISFSRMKIGGISLSERSHNKAVQRGLKKLPFRPDAIYGHFWQSAYESWGFAKREHIPLIVATGESSIREMFSCDVKLKDFYNYVSGVVCVSSKNRDESLELGLTVPEKCRVIPNAIDAESFKKIDKAYCRNRLHYPQNSFIVAFVGWFNQRKGVRRVSEAIKLLNDPSINSVFVGSGDIMPECDGILFRGSVEHSEIPYYLNAADVFVLPTLHEGCCNAVVEALSCGLPVISSNKSFNWDILNESNSIMVDPEDVSQIADAIYRLKTDETLRMKLSAGALNVASDLSIVSRAEKIESFIKEKITDNVSN